MRRSLLPLTIALFALIATDAQAAHVDSLQNWTADNQYLVQANVDGRTAPQSEPRAVIDWRKKGQWVKITCQAKGEGKLWDLVGGYYVPDDVIKTYTENRIPGAPHCGQTQSPPPTTTPPPPPPPPAPDPSQTLADPEGGYGSYEQTYSLGTRFAGWDYDELTHELTHHFSTYFPFKGCGRTIKVGKECRLKVAHSPDGPVRVVAIADNGIQLLSLPGHPEGAGRTITFRWQVYCSRMTDYQFCDTTYLTVNAWGPVSYGSLLGPLNSDTVAKHYWSKLARNVKDDYPRCPSGKAWNSTTRSCGIYI